MFIKEKLRESLDDLADLNENILIYKNTLKSIEKIRYTNS